MNSIALIILLTFPSQLFSSEYPKIYRNGKTAIVSFGKREHTRFSQIVENGPEAPLHSLAGQIAYNYFERHPENSKASFKKFPLMISGHLIGRMSFDASRMPFDKKAVKIKME